VPSLRSFASSLAALAAACSLSAPPADATLGLASAGDIDELAAAALAAARAATGEEAAARQIEASQALFQAADLRLQRASKAWLDAHPAATLAEVVDAEECIGDDDRQAILSLCTAGLELATAARAASPREPAAALHVGLHLSLVAWVNGPMRSLVAGHGPALVTAIEDAVELDRTFDGGAPLRLQGRFRGRAPWPYGDRSLARESLAAAVALRSVPVSHLFYGDVLLALGDLDAAREQWRLAVEAPADASTRWSADLLRDLAQRRLAAR
jgi:hypothetical protein